MTVINVSGAKELATALANARSGDQIVLAPGDYGELAVKNRSFTEAVTITAQDPDNPPIFSSISLFRVSGMTFDSIEVDFTPTATTLEWSSAFRADGSHGITVRNSTLIGGDSVAGVPADSPAGSQGNAGILGYPTGRGMTFNNVSNLVIEGNSILEFSSGIRFSNADDVVIANNEIADFRRVGLGGANVSNMRIEGNYIHDANPWKYGGLGDHGDFVHFWTTPTQTKPSENISFIGNHMAQGDGTPIIGIYLDDNTNGIGFRDVLIENNILHNGNGQALRMEDVVGLTVKSNTIVQTVGSENTVPSIYLADGTREVTVTDNILAGIVGPALSAANAQIQIYDNVLVQASNPSAPNYVGNLLINPLSTDSSLVDLRPIPGGIATGHGAEIGPAKDAVLITNTSGDGIELDSLTFSLDTLGSLGGINLSGAHVLWNFGDGTSAKGAIVTHDYDNFGAHEVTANITLANGTRFLLQKTVEVQNPISTFVDFDESTYHNFALKGNVKYVEGADGNTAVRVVGAQSTVTFDQTESMTQNSEFTISFDFKKDVGAEGSGGRALYFNGTAVIDIGADGLTLRGRTDIGESIVLKARGVGIQDSDWHRVTYSFSQEDGSAVLYLDGQEVSRVDGLQGAQYVTKGHSMHLGDPFGKSFGGLLDNVVFLKDSVEPEDLSAWHTNDSGADTRHDSFTAHLLAWADGGQPLL